MMDQAWNNSKMVGKMCRGCMMCEKRIMCGGMPDQKRDPPLLLLE